MTFQTTLHDTMAQSPHHYLSVSLLLKNRHRQNICRVSFAWLGDAYCVQLQVVQSAPFLFAKVQRSMIKIAESSIKLGQHSDTSFSAGSLRAARRAAGAVKHAVDWYVERYFLSILWKESYLNIELFSFIL